MASEGGGGGGDPIKIVLLGSSGVGKSNLIHRFHSNEFSNEFMSTIGVEFVTKKVDVDGNSVRLQIWDTAGQERYASMMKTYYRKARGALLVYDVSSPTSFQSMETWRRNLEAHAAPNCSVIVCGNKADVDAAVTPEEGKAYADEHGMGFVSTSAKTGEGVSKAFDEVTRRILASNSNSSSGNAGMTLRSTNGGGRGGDQGGCC